MATYVSWDFWNVVAIVSFARYFISTICNRAWSLCGTLDLPLGLDTPFTLMANLTSAFAFATHSIHVIAIAVYVLRSYG